MLRVMPRIKYNSFIKKSPSSAQPTLLGRSGDQNEESGRASRLGRFLFPCTYFRTAQEAAMPSRTSGLSKTIGRESMAERCDVRRL